MASKTFEADVFEFGQAVGLLIRRFRAAAGSEELSWTEAAVLKRLEKGGPVTTADLARAEAVRPQSMRSIITALEKKGLVARKPHPTDGRQVFIQLSRGGIALRKRTGDASRTWLAKTIAQLDRRDQATLFAAGKIIKCLVEQ